MSFENIEIRSFATFDELEPYFSSFSQSYQIIFANPPYNERFYPNEVEGLLRHHLKGATQSTLLAIKDSRVIGFALGSSVRDYPEIAKKVRGLLPVKQTYYLVELGVVPEFRRNGLGQELTNKQMHNIDRSHFNYIILRASHSEDAAHAMYQEMGFEDMGVYMDINSRKTDGSTRSDRRLILSKMIFQQ